MCQQEEKCILNLQSTRNILSVECYLPLCALGFSFFFFFFNKRWHHNHCHHFLLLFTYHLDLFGKMVSVLGALHMPGRPGSPLPDTYITHNNTHTAKLINTSAVGAIGGHSASIFVHSCTIYEIRPCGQALSSSFKCQLDSSLCFLQFWRMDWSSSRVSKRWQLFPRCYAKRSAVVTERPRTGDASSDREGETALTWTWTRSETFQRGIAVFLRPKAPTGQTHIHLAWIIHGAWRAVLTEEEPRCFRCPGGHVPSSSTAGERRRRFTFSPL